MSTDGTSKQVALPDMTQRVLRLLIQSRDSCLLRIGRLEAEYVNTKDRLFTELRTLQQEESRMLDAAAKEAGLDLEKERWIFDSQTLTLVQVSEPPKE